MSTPIILASASPRRKILLNQIGLQPIIHPADIDETVSEEMNPESAATSLAEQKGEHIAGKYKDGLIISADTIVVLDNQLLGKPVDKNEATDFLNRLSDKTHRVITGVTILHKKEGNTINKTSFFEETKVTFGKLSDLEIASYIETGSPMDKAGGYGIQDDLGALFVRKIEGCYYNVVGFPIFHFYQTLKLHYTDLLKDTGLFTK